MPQITGSSEECTCKDEVRVYKDEGEEEEEKNRSSENLSEDKVNLVTEGEDQKPLNFSHIFPPVYDSVFNVPFDYFFPPYPSSYAAAFSQDSFNSKVPFMPPNPGTLGFMPFAMRDAMGSCGLNGALGFPNTYPFSSRNGFMFGPHISALCSENLASMWANSSSQSFPLLNPFMSSVSRSSGSSSVSSSNHNVSTSGITSSCSNTTTKSTIVSPVSKESTTSNGMMHVPSPLRPTPINLSTYSSLSLKCTSDSKETQNNTDSDKWKETSTSQIYSSFQFVPSITVSSSISPTSSSNQVNSNPTLANSSSSQMNDECKKHDKTLHDSKFCKSNHHKDSQKPHIKKPLNAFMLFMKEMRQKVQEECTLKESAAINQILGKKWHTLSREEQSKYYEIARKEKQLHVQLFPEWSARDNYAIHSKHKKKRRMNQGNCPDGTDSKTNDSNSMKKCRARYGIEQMSQWCKPCRRKKKCIRFLRTEENISDSGLKEKVKGNGNSTFQRCRELSSNDADSGVSKDQFSDEKAPSPQGPFLSDTELMPNGTSETAESSIKMEPETFKPQIDLSSSSSSGPLETTLPSRVSTNSVSCASFNNSTSNSEVTSNLIPSPSSAFSSLKSSLNNNPDKHQQHLHYQQHSNNNNNSSNNNKNNQQPNGCKTKSSHISQTTVLI